MTLKQAQARIKELEGMVAMAMPPSSGVYPMSVCLLWREEQKKIQRKLDGIAKRMNRKVFKDNNNG